jgi:hypothetical protein
MLIFSYLFSTVGISLDFAFAALSSHPFSGQWLDGAVDHIAC